MNITINTVQQHYVLSFNGGHTCHGFANVRGDVDALTKVMALPPVLLPDGSIELYKAYQDLVTQFGRHAASKRTWFGPGTDPKVARVLESAYHGESLIRIFYGDPITGQDWCEENDVVGFVGRSNGPFKVPLLLEAYRTSSKGFESSQHGAAILCRSVVRIIDVLSCEELYRHKSYKLPQLKVLGAGEDLRKKGYFFSVFREFDNADLAINMANCKTEEEARAFVAFMQGLRIQGAFRTRAQAAADLEV